jgi:hypothetical protein
MNDSAGLIDVWPELSVLAAMTLIFLFIGSILFTWHEA